MKSAYVIRVKRCALLVTLALVFVSLPSSGTEIIQQGWPVVALPQDATAYPIGDRITANGIPLRIKGFVARSGSHAMVKWFRTRLGEPMVETRMGKFLILGKAQKDYFITIQMTPAGTGTTGTVTVSHLRDAYESRDKTKAALSRLLAHLPAGSKIETDLVSTDGGKLSRYYIVSNTQHADVNRDRILDLMRQDGMKLQYQGSGEERRLASRVSVLLQNGRTLFFHGERKEAVVVIGRNASGVTVMQVNVISEAGMINE